MTWIEFFLRILSSFIGMTLALILMYRPLTNGISRKVHRRLMKQITKAEDEFAKRGRI